MKDIKDKSIDMILCDLPYGTTQNKWDCVIDLDKLWNQYERIIKDNSYRQEIVNTAYEQIKKFEYKHFKKRLGDIIRREGYKVIGN